MVGLAWQRPELQERIAARVARMLEAGLLEEARRVFEMRERLARTPLQAVGYKEFFPFFAGESPLEKARDDLERNTRRLAKSQSTWFRKFPVRWIAMSAARPLDEVAREAIDAWQSG